MFLWAVVVAFIRRSSLASSCFCAVQRYCSVRRRFRFWSGKVFACQLHFQSLYTLTLPITGLQLLFPPLFLVVGTKVIVRTSSRLGMALRSIPRLSTSPSVSASRIISSATCSFPIVMARLFIVNCGTSWKGAFLRMVSNSRNMKTRYRKKRFGSDFIFSAEKYLWLRKCFVVELSSVSIDQLDDDGVQQQTNTDDLHLWILVPRWVWSSTGGGLRQDSTRYVS
jgi:hypothetical protein